MFRFSEPSDDSPLAEKSGLDSSILAPGVEQSRIFKRLFLTELSEGLDHAVETSFGPNDRNIYKLNSYGFRSPEYHKSNGLLALGCSQTMGMGVPEDGTWPHFLAKSLGLKYSKIAYGGWSIQTIVMNAFAYFREFGHPEVVALLLPDPNRTKVIAKSGLVDDRYSNALTRDIQYRDISIYDSTLWRKPGSERPKYSKRPHLLQDILTVEHAVFYSFQMLGMLIQYCSANNINLVWGTWDIRTETIVKELKSRETDFDLSGYVWGLDSLVRKYADDKKPPECHLKERKKYAETFIVGSDESGHMGVHSHMHIAERFRLKLLGAD